MARLVGNRVVATGLSGRTDLNDALGTGVTSKLVVVDAPMSHFVTAVAQHAAEYEAPKEGEESLPFPNVD